MQNIKPLCFFLLQLLFFQSQNVVSQSDFKYNDLDNAYREEISVENKALTDRIKKLPPEVIDLNAKIAQSLRENNVDNALKYATVMDSIYPNNADIKNFKGKMYAKMSNPILALKSFDEAIKIDPTNRWFYINKATVLADENLKKDALKVISELVGFFPNWSVGYNFKAAILKDLGKNEEALKTYDKAVKAEPKSAQIHCNRGDLYLLMKNQKQAIADYSKALEIQPTYVRAKEKLELLVK
jgi:tetratricopeptide (TPR) repeat protein